MTVNIGDVIYRAKIILQDAASVRWPVSELALWALDGAKEIALLQPSATAVTITQEMVSGTRQVVAPEYQSMIRAVRNMSGTTGGRSITSVAREVLDNQSADWHDPAKVAFRQLVRHVIIDVQDPASFYVYPGNDGTGEIECVMSIIPVFSADPVNPDELDDYAAITVPLIGVYLSAVVNYVLSRAFSKDSQLADSANRAVAHYNQFMSAVTARQNANATANPNTTNAQPH